MKLARLLLITVLTLATGAAYADAESKGSLGVKTFQFKYKDAQKAASAIKPLMSAEGSFSIQPSTNALVVTDKPENLKAISAAILQFDAPARLVHLKVRLVSAARAEAPSRVPEELKDIAGKLAVLRYNSLETIGDVNVDGKEGDPSIVDLKGGYRADFRFGDYDAASDSIHISDFKLSKLQGAELTQVLTTSLNVKYGQVVVLGAARLPESQRALMIVVSATR
jgi:hypothetical protein